MEITITSEQKILVTLAPVTAAGNPAAVDGDAAFIVASGDATIEQVSSLSAFIVSGASGVASVIEVSADADLGTGIRSIADVINLSVVAPEATNLGLVIGAPELK